MDEQSAFEEFLQIHQQQLVASSVPDWFWPSLFYKLKHEIYDAGNSFQIQQVVGEDDGEEDGGSSSYSWRVVVTQEEGIDPRDPHQVYLIDHAWTYRMGDARPALTQVPGLKERMAALMDVDTEGTDGGEGVIESVLVNMWKYCQCYKFGHLDRGSDEAMPMWYIMDEFGSRIQHNDSPSVRVVPFFYAGSNLAFSVMWPVKSMEEGDEVSRNYVEQSSGDVRTAKLLPWLPTDMTHVDFTQEEPSLEHYESYKMSETQPSPAYRYPGLPRDRNLRVYVDYDAFSRHLTDQRFQIVDSPDDADVIWYINHFHDYKSFSEAHPSSLINQFPCDMVVTVKDMLAITSRRAATPGQQDPMEPNPRWLPVTYDLQTELPKFVSYFQHRKEKGLDNHWICKPWNLARGLDTYVTDNLDLIVRLPDAGPKVACKYIHDPVLYYREDLGSKVKFDIRYIVMLTSTQPLKLYAYKVFWLRFANKPYSLDHLDDYEKHFTVMNYDNRTLKQVHYDEFIPEFESQNPDFVWTDVENDIFNMFRELFSAATSVPPPRGICPSPQSRAMYAVDLMLAWDKKPNGDRCIQPMICEVNFAPDCDRACLYHPFFVDDCFSVMFLDDTEDKHVTPL